MRVTHMLYTIYIYVYTCDDLQTNQTFIVYIISYNTLRSMETAAALSAREQRASASAAAAATVRLTRANDPSRARAVCPGPYHWRPRHAAAGLPREAPLSRRSRRLFRDHTAAVHANAYE